MSKYIAVWALAIALLSLNLISIAEAEPSRSTDRVFDLDDYFRVRRIVETALSADGQCVIYITEMPLFESDGVQRIAYMKAIARNAHPTKIVELSDARQIAWIGSTSEVAFLSNRTGKAQVFAYNIETRKMRQVTNGSDPVTKFRVAPNGAVAYLTLTSVDSLYEQMRRDGPGILIDTDIIGYQSLIDEGQRPAVNPGAWHLWIASSAGKVSPVQIPGDVQEFFWSSDEALLSVTYVATDIPQSMFRMNRTSIGTVNAGTRELSPIAIATPRSRVSDGKSFFGGEWIPGRREMVVRRVVEAHDWLYDWSFPEWAIANVEGTWKEATASWTPLEMTRQGSSVTPVDSTKILLETRIRAVDSLLTLTNVSAQKSGIAGATSGIPGSNSMFRFSLDFETAVFVNESLNRPPELYMWTKGSKARQLTQLNDEIARRVLPRVTEVNWTSKDGTEISGWLLSPVSPTYKRPWPLITFTKGGPAYVFRDSFAPLSALWPYPLEVFALRGMAIFVPNYRGTVSFGKKIAFASRIDKEPIDDIVTGIEFLIDHGIADSKRLGIAGHSHGAWLGPMVATRTKLFRAGSFAEGWSNQVALYELHSGQMNREVHEAGMREEALYERPERYLELSPDLHFRGVAMASLFEAGSEAIATTMLGMPKAARYFGSPTEFIIYPRTGHTLTIPHLQRESAERNLDWFCFWLMDQEDPDSKKVTQYERWRQLRNAAILSVSLH